MEELRQILDALGIHSLKVAAAILAVTLLTSIVKIPVKRAANKYAENGGNKSLINALIVFICITLSFLAALFLELLRVNWDWSAIAWGGKVSDVLPNWAIIAVMSSTLYSIIWQSVEKGISAAFKTVLGKIFNKRIEQPKEQVEVIPAQIIEEPKPEVAKKAKKPDDQPVPTPMKETRR